MRINHNIPALRALHQLNMNNSKLDKTLERLSSGLRINHSSDDAAGLAITQKMDTQVRGLEQAKRNTMDGISLIQTAEGALNEVHSMLQRIRELSVQASNGTYDSTDRDAIQKEVGQLQKEILRISEDIEFNEKKLLNGDIDRRAFPEHEDIAKIISLSDTVKPGNYKINITGDATKAIIKGGASTVTTSTIGKSGKISLNGEEIEIEATDTASDVFNKLRTLGEKVGAKLTAKDSSGNPAQFEFNKNMKLELEINQYGAQHKLNLQGSTDLLSSLGLSAQTVKGKDVEVSIDTTNSDFSPSATIAVKGNVITVSDINGFEMKFEAQKDTATNNSAYKAGIEEATTNQSLDPVKSKVFVDTYINALRNGNTSSVAKTKACTASGLTSVQTTSVVDAILAVGQVEAEKIIPSLGDKIKNNLGKSDNEIINAITAIPNPATEEQAKSALAAYKAAVFNQTKINVLDAGPLDLQIGANEGQSMEIRIPNLSPKALEIENLNLSTVEGAEYALKIVDEAINKISGIRAKLGAYQNRLEHTVNNLSVASESMTESMSRIQDADMAFEMAQYTQKNIITQAGTSMLAQANQRPQSILQLLQG
jgi:flagellin